MYVHKFGATSKEMLLTRYLMHDFVENSLLFYVASDLCNNLEHANLAQNVYVAIYLLQVCES